MKRPGKASHRRPGGTVPAGPRSSSSPAAAPAPLIRSAQPAGRSVSAAHMKRHDFLVQISK